MTDEEFSAQATQLHREINELLSRVAELTGMMQPLIQKNYDTATDANVQNTQNTSENAKAKRGRPRKTGREIIQRADSKTGTEVKND